MTSDANNSCQKMFNIVSGWTGNIYVTGLQKCGASNVVVDSNRSYNMAALRIQNAKLAGEVTAAATVAAVQAIVWTNPA